MIIQIYEISSVSEAHAMQLLDVDHIGFWVSEKPDRRALTPKQGRAIRNAVRLPHRSVMLILSTDIEEIAAVWMQVQADIIHLGVEAKRFSPTTLKALKARIPSALLMVTIAVRSDADIDLAKSFEDIADFLLLDTVDEATQNIGVTGTVHDWAISERIARAVRTPIILAGGLSPDNVQAAIQRVSPWGVDSKTHTDRTGDNRKDIAMVEKFVRASRNQSSVAGQIHK